MKRMLLALAIIATLGFAASPALADPWHGGGYGHGHGHHGPVGHYPRGGVGGYGYPGYRVYRPYYAPVYGPSCYGYPSAGFSLYGPGYSFSFGR